MAAGRREDDKPFLSRWSQRKRQAEEGAPQAEDPAAKEAEPVAEPEEIAAAELPDIDSLDVNSDFTVFLRKGVPNALKQKALRRLWQVDPAFKHICMLDDYNQDFTDAATVVPNLKTIYQVGRGMLVDEDAEAVADADPPRRQPEPESGAPEEPAAVAGDTTAAVDAPGEGEPAPPEPAAAPNEPCTPQAVPAPPAEALPTSPGSRSARSGTRSALRRRWGDSDA